MPTAMMGVPRKPITPPSADFDEDEDDGSQQRQEGVKGGGQIAGFLQGNLVVLDMLGGTHPVFAVLGGDLVQALAQPAGVEAAGDGHGDGQHDAQQDKLAHIRPKGARNAKRAGGRRHQGVGDYQAGGQGAGNGHNGAAGLFGDGLGDGADHHKAGIAEDGDGHDEAGEGHSPVLPLFAKKLDEGQGHPLGSAGLVKDLPHHHAKADDDADAAQGAAKAVDDGGGNIGRRQAAANADKGGGNDECQERVDLGLKDQEDQQHDTDEQCYDHLHTVVHKYSPLIVGPPPCGEAPPTLRRISA